RALIFEELENVPMERPAGEISRAPLGMSQMSQLMQMLSDGNSAVGKGARIERAGEWKYIKWSDDASKLLSQVKMYWREKALIEQDSGSGLESQALGAPELTIKVAGILCANTEMISKEALEWAHELIKKVTHDKIDRARNNEMLSSNDSIEKGGGLLGSIMRHINSLPEGEHTTAGKARQAAGRNKVTLDDARQGLDHLSAQGKVRIEQLEAKNGKKITRYFKA
ncbi:MAG TPA: hypothetical protein VL020_02255, partial [Pseudomonadales bacterium]|nr:hypothetical protein [Pseudomonadales bacterium]